MHKLVKPLCLSPVKMKICGQNNSEPYTTESPTPDPWGHPIERYHQSERRSLLRFLRGNWPMQSYGRQESTNIPFDISTQDFGNLVKDILVLLYRRRCRRFMDLTPGETHGVLWLSMIAEFMYISLSGMGFLLLWVEVMCFRKEMHTLKINAFTAICTVLSGLLGMVAHMMYTTVFQLTVIVGPKD
ncbi:germ cell-specific gene 1-like protein [Xyrauchen texanus]|uniref:germ cell-specific gene 1-like protein n=1 Tax=Xyrauchen texanus TaxID=154827 RepID=UPI0022421589|nr:germ cell-specific gene 1-like protein [Xyrauchen texanus]